MISNSTSDPNVFRSETAEDFCALRDDLEQRVVAPVRDNVLALTGRRMRMLNLTDSQKREILLWARGSRSALEGFRSKDSASFAQVRERGAAASSSPGKKPGLP